MLREKIARDINKMAMAKAAAGDDFRYIGPNDRTKNWLASRTADINGAMNSIGDVAAGVRDYLANDFDGDAMGAAEGAGRFFGKYGPIVGDAAEMSAKQIGDAGTYASDEAQARAFLARQELDRLKQKITGPIEDAAGRAVEYGKGTLSSGRDFIDRLGSSFNVGMNKAPMADEEAFQATRRAEIESKLKMRPAIESILAAITSGPAKVSDMVSDAASTASTGMAEVAKNKRREDILGEQDSLMAAGNDTGIGATLREMDGGLEGGIGSLMEGIKADPNARTALAVGAGGLGAAGILRLIKLLRGRGAGPAPI